MRIHLVSFCYGPDFDLLRLLFCTALKHAGDRIVSCTTFKDEKFVLSHEQGEILKSMNVRVLPQGHGYTPFPHWRHAMVKNEAYRVMLDTPGMKDDDYMVDVDSDVVFMNDKIFNELGECDFMGMPHSETIFSRRFASRWTWVSGCAMFFRVGALRKMLAIQGDALQEIRVETVKLGLAHVHDVVSSYLIRCVTDRIKHLHGVISPDPEGSLLRGTPETSLVHLMGQWRAFGGIPVKSKDEIPSALQQLGVTLC